MASEYAKFNGIGGPKKATKKLTKRFLDACAKHGVPMENFIAPGGTTTEIMDSLVGQLGSASCNGPLDLDRVELAFDRVVSTYTPTERAYFQHFHEGIHKILDSFDGTKSAGWSGMFRPGAKCVWQTPDGKQIASYLARCRTLLRLAWGHETMNHMTPAELVRHGLSDPRVLFIKGEPHGAKKIASKRWRLIWAASLVDSLCTCLTSKLQDKKDIEQYQTSDETGKETMACIGIGHDDDGIQRFGKILQHIGSAGTIVDEDAQGWDISVSRASLYLDARRRCELYVGPNRETFERMQWCEAVCNTAHVVAFGTSLVQIEKAGITGSGVSTTSAQNSFVRALLAIYAGAQRVAAVGDDLVADFMTVEASAATGVRSKGVTSAPPEGPVSFTSHEFTFDGSRWHARFLNLTKMLARLALTFPDPNLPPSYEALAGCLFALRHSDAERTQFNAMCEEMGWSLDGVIPMNLDPEADL